VTALSLSPEAAAFVRARGGALTVRASPKHGCCGGTVAVLVAEPGAPADPGAFAVVEASGVRAYLSPEASAAGPLRVGLDRFLALAALYVEGAAPP